MTDAFTRRDISLANWRLHPFTHYSFHHVGEFVPSAEITRQKDDVPHAGLSGLDGMTVLHPSLGECTVPDFLSKAHGDGFVALKAGKVIAEWYAPWSSETSPHLVFSVTKSVTGMLAGIAWGDGRLDPDAPIGAYVPVPPACAYASARVRDLLDMTVRLDFIEDYLDRDGPFDRYRRAMLWNPERADAKQEGMLDVLSTLPRAEGEHGNVFYYASPDTDMLGLVVEAATGQRWHELLRDRIWEPMGATGQASITVDRFGELVMNDGRGRSGAQLIPAKWIADMRNNGDHAAWAAGGFPGFLPAGNYRSCWYIAKDGRGSFAAVGIHGQHLWVDPTSGVSIVKLSSFPAPSDDDAANADFEVLAQIAKAL